MDRRSFAHLAVQVEAEDSRCFPNLSTINPSSRYFEECQASLLYLSDLLFEHLYEVNINGRGAKVIKGDFTGNRRGLRRSWGMKLIFPEA